MRVGSRMEIFEPLGLTATGFYPPAVLRPLIPPTEEDTTFRHRASRAKCRMRMPGCCKASRGHAGLFSNVPDLLRFAAEILGGCKLGRRSPASRTLFEPGTIESSPCARVLKELARARLGYAVPESSAGQSFLASLHRASGLQRLLALDRSGCLRRAVSCSPTAPGPIGKARLIREVRPAFHDAVREALAAA